MNINELKAFIAVVQSGSLTQAALRLNRVQSSISQRIQNLERKLNVTLLERQADGVKPTLQGIMVYEYAVKIVDTMRECQEKIECYNYDNKRIRVGVVECLPAYIVDNLLDFNYNGNFNISVSIGSSHNLLDFFEKGDFDIIIIGAGFASSNVMRTPVFQDQLVVINSNSLPPITDFYELQDQIFLLSSEKAASRRNINYLMRDKGILPKKIVECGSYPILFSQVAAGKGISLVLRSALSKVYSDKIRINELSGKYFKMQIEMIFRSDIIGTNTLELRRMICELFKSQSLKTPWF